MKLGKVAATNFRLLVFVLVAFWLLFLSINSEWTSNCLESGSCLIEYTVIFLTLLMPAAVVLVVSYILKVRFPVLSLLACAVVPIFFVDYSITGDANAPLIIAVTPFYSLFFAGVAFLFDMVIMHVPKTSGKKSRHKG